MISLSCNIIVFFSFDTIRSEPIFLNCVFPFRWLVNEVRGMFQSLFGLLSEITPLLTTSIASLNASFVHLPLVATTIFHVGIVGDYFLAWPSERFSWCWTMWSYNGWFRPLLSYIVWSWANYSTKPKCFLQARLNIILFWSS